MNIYHLSDLHIINGDNIIPMLTRLGKEKPGIVIITGDITDNGYKDEIGTAFTLLNELLEKHVILCVPGNHDYGFKGNCFLTTCFNNFRKFLFCPLQNYSNLYFDNPWLQYENFLVWEQENTVFIGLDSADFKNTEFSARGKLDDRYLAEFHDILVEYCDYKKVVFLHHHPFIRPDIYDFFQIPYDYFMELENADKFMKICQYEKVDLLLFGHKHKYGEYIMDGIGKIYASGQTIDTYKTYTIGK
jgi:3',5'-cyclic AMP phosphodiesterase CpdA